MTMIKEFLLKLKAKYLPDGSFRSNLAVISIGRISSQIIPLLITPILTRIYTPGDFGILATFTAVVTIISLVSTGRYSLAITLPKESRKSIELFLISILGVVFCSILVLLLLLFFKSKILTLLSLENNPLFILFFPLVIFILGSMETVYYSLLRRRDFAFISKNFFIQTAVINILKLIFAFLWGGWFSLILAYTIGTFLSSSLLFIRFIKKTNIREITKEVSANDLKTTAIKYKNFPLYSMLADGINSFAIELPNILLNGLFGASITGFYSITQRVLRLPVAFITAGMTDVYRERASSDFREKGNCSKIYLATLKVLTLLSFFPFLLIFLFAPSLIPIVLGDQWVEVGQYIKILTPLFFFKFIAHPLGSTLYISERQKVNLFWQTGFLLCTLSSFYVGFLLRDHHLALLFYSISSAIMYIILIILGYGYSKKRKMT